MRRVIDWIASKLGYVRHVPAPAKGSLDYFHSDEWLRLKEGWQRVLICTRLSEGPLTLRELQHKTDLLTHADGLEELLAEGSAAGVIVVEYNPEGTVYRLRCS